MTSAECTQYAPAVGFYRFTRQLHGRTITNRNYICAVIWSQLVDLCSEMLPIPITVVDSGKKLFTYPNNPTETYAMKITLSQNNNIKCNF